MQCWASVVDGRPTLDQHRVDVSSLLETCTVEEYIVQKAKYVLTKTRVVDAMLFQCWANIVDGGPTLNQHSVNILCLLSFSCKIITCLTRRRARFSDDLGFIILHSTVSAYTNRHITLIPLFIKKYYLLILQREL